MLSKTRLAIIVRFVNFDRYVRRRRDNRALSVVLVLRAKTNSVRVWGCARRLLLTTLLAFSPSFLYGVWLRNERREYCFGKNLMLYILWGALRN